MFQPLDRTARKAAAGLLKGAMALGMLLGLIAIPYLIVTEGYSLLAGLFRQHPLWFVLALIPVVYLAIKLWKWLYELLGATMLTVGRVVDKLEQDQN